MILYSKIHFHWSQRVQEWCRSVYKMCVDRVCSAWALSIATTDGVKQRQHVAFILPRGLCDGASDWQLWGFYLSSVRCGCVLHSCCFVLHSSERCIDGMCKNQIQHLQVKDQIVESFLWYAVMEPHCGRGRGQKKRKFFIVVPCTMWPPQQLMSNRRLNRSLLPVWGELWVLLLIQGEALALISHVVGEF